jgi:dihydrofolate reductase
MGDGVFDNETMTFINETYQRRRLLFGRRTAELAGYWARGAPAPRRKIRATTRSRMP